MDESNEQRGSAFRLLDLPFEIRAAIYRIFFSGQPRSITYPCNRPFSLIDDRHWNLLLASPKIYYEAIPEYYRACIFGLYTLNAPHVRKLMNDMEGTHLTRYGTKLLIWKVPEPDIFQVLTEVKWVKLLGITCGVEPDESNGQIFTYDSLMTALRKSRVPGFSWDRCQDLFAQYKHIDFMVDLRCDYWETKLDADGHPHRKWIKTNFVYVVKINTFVEEIRGTSKLDGLILRPQEIDTTAKNPGTVSLAYIT